MVHYQSITSRLQCSRPAESTCVKAELPPLSPVAKSSAPKEVISSEQRRVEEEARYVGKSGIFT